jgi:hypothetical protein
MLFYRKKFGTFCKHAVNVLQRVYISEMFSVLGTGTRTHTGIRTQKGARTRTRTGTQTGTQTGTRAQTFSVWKKKNLPTTEGVQKNCFQACL